MRTLATRRYPAGPVQLAWDGRTRGARKQALGGRYALRVVARTPFGRIELTRDFRVQRIAGPKPPPAEGRG